MARPAGIEPTTPWFVAKYSIQLSYGREDRNYNTRKLIGERCQAAPELTLMLGPVKIVSCLMDLLTQRAALFRRQSRRTTLFLAMTRVVLATLAGWWIARPVWRGPLLPALRGRRSKRQALRAKQERETNSDQAELHQKSKKRRWAAWWQCKPADRTS